MITVQDVIRLALPVGTQVVAGELGLGREVTWATRLRPTAPAFEHLSGGELVLLPANILELVDERFTLDAAVKQLASFDVAAIAHVGRMTASARAAADAVDLPLLALPSTADLNQLERDASRLITERRRELQRRGQEAGRRLMELAIAGESLATIVREVSDLSGRVVVLESRDGRLISFASPEGDETSRDSVETWLDDGRLALVQWMRSGIVNSSADPPSTTLALGGAARRVVAPIIGRDGMLGTLSLVHSDEADAPEDGVLASRGAAACAVALAREQAAQTARRELELNVLDEVLDGALRSEMTLLQQAKRLGHDLTQPHVAIVARLDQSGPVRQRDGRWSVLDDVMGKRGARGLWRLRNNNAEIILPVTKDVDAKTLAKALHEDLNRRISGEKGTSGAGSVNVSVGVGRVASGLAGIRGSYQEARQSLTMGRRLQGPGGMTAFDDLGVYRVIFAAEGLPELRSFHDETLGKLIGYDVQHGGDLIKTLDAFFSARCSPKEAATMLGVHRNTVLYRLDRIREITAMDLDDAEIRLRMHLALCAHQAVFGEALA